MADVFNAEEILEMACRIEENGARFYRRAAEIVPDEESRETLLRLAAMEDDHEKTFDSMRADVSRRTELLGQPDEAAALTLRTLADEQIFPRDQDPTAKLEKGATMEEILRMAIGMEKDSIVFYLGLRDLVPEGLGRAKVESIIREEMGHVTELGEMLGKGPS